MLFLAAMQMQFEPVHGCLSALFIFHLQMFLSKLYKVCIMQMISSRLVPNTVFRFHKLSTYLHKKFKEKLLHQWTRNGVNVGVVPTYLHLNNELICADAAVYSPLPSSKWVVLKAS